MMADIRRNQGRLQEAHERSKTVTRSEEMKKLREQMQAGAAEWCCCGVLLCGAALQSSEPAGVGCGDV